MLLCVHTYLTNCPTKASYGTVQHSLNQSWVPVINQMCNINTNSSKQPLPHNSDQTTGADPVPNLSPQKLPSYHIQNDLPAEKSMLSQSPEKGTKGSIYSVILDRIILPEVVIDSGVPVILNSKDKNHKIFEIAPKTNKLVSSDSPIRGRNLLYWMYIVIGDSGSADQIQHVGDYSRSRPNQGEVTSLSYKSSASHVTLSVLCVWHVLVTVFVLCAH